MNHEPHQNRIDSIDALRGLAVMGILWVNLPGHAFSFYAYSDPTLAGGDGLNVSVWHLSATVVEGTMRGLFSFLFGIGAALRFQSGIKPKPYFIRYFWLMLFGAFHGTILLMPGDVLLAYGIVALFLLPLRNVGVKGLIAISIISTISLATLAALDAYETSILGAFHPPTIDQLGHASYGEVFDLYTIEYFYYIFSADFIALFLDAYIMMTLGMAAYKSGFFDENKKVSRNTIAAAMIFITLGLVARFYCTKIDELTFYSGAYWPTAALRELARPVLTLGYAILFIFAWRLGILNWASKSLIALGRMALTNYLMQTIIAIFLFYGFGLGLYNDFNRIQLIPIIAAIWVTQIIYSRVWLSKFPQGPFEWLWRRLSSLGRAASILEK